MKIKIIALALAAVLLTGCGTSEAMNHTENKITQEETMDYTDIENALPALVKNSLRIKPAAK